MQTNSLINIKNHLFTCNIPIRISDINYGNHVGHDSLISILHESRCQYLKYHNLNELNIYGTGIILTKLNIEYKSEIQYDDELKISIYLENFSKVGFAISYLITNITKKREVANAITELVFFDYQSKKVKKMPEEFKKLIFDK